MPDEHDVPELEHAESSEEAYLKLVQGEITPAQYVESVERDVEEAHPDLVQAVRRRKAS